MILKKMCLFFCIFLAYAGVSFAENATSEPLTASLIHEDTALHPGKPFWVGIRLELQDHWHIYWKNPGDAGMATQVEWKLPEGFKTSQIIWPTPEKFVFEGVVGYGYTDEVILFSEIIPPSSLTNDSPVTIEAAIQWLVCSDSLCMPGETDLSTTLKVLNGAPKKHAQWAQLFTEARENLPNKHEDVVAYRKKDSIELKVELSDQTENWQEAHFFPEEHHVIDHKKEVILNSSQTRSYILNLSLSPKSTETSSLKGIIVLKGGTKENPTSYALEINTPIIDERENLISMADVPSNQADIPAKVSSISPAPEFEGGLTTALLFAFLGGMILNLMPCVLPVVSFKVLSFVKMAGQSRKLTFAHGLAFSLGVLVSFWILASALLILKFYGHSVGWGFQLQEPLFVAFLAALLLALGLSLFGVFELGSFASNLAGKIGSKRVGFTGSFLSGVLATAVATPCTGPFLGSAIGFAFSVSTPSALSIFTFLGFGMALPYLILATFPGLLRFIPKPGAWMDSFREAMGLIMIATVLWLTWVFSAQTSSLAVVILLAGFFCVAVACWIYGRWGSPVQSAVSRTISYVFALACLTAAFFIILNSTAPWVASLDRKEMESVANADSWEGFSLKRLTELREEGVPVFVDFTAKWCLICQVNRVILDNNSVQKKMDEMGIVKMKADWTKNDPIITEELRKLGRSGVPLYVLYKPHEEVPTILPQMLTVDTVLENLDHIEEIAAS